MRVDPSALVDDPRTYVPVPASSTIVILISSSSINIICSRRGNTSEEEGTTVTSKGVVFPVLTEPIAIGKNPTSDIFPVVYVTVPTSLSTIILSCPDVL